MSGAIERNRLVNKYHQTDVFYGDESVGFMDEFLKAIGEASAKEKAEKTAATEKLKKEQSPESRAAFQASESRKKATYAQSEANADLRKADALEKDKNGPMHVAARKKKAQADMASSDARAQEEKLAFYQPEAGTQRDGRGKEKKDWKSYLTPQNMMFAGAGLIGLVLVVKLMRR